MGGWGQLGLRGGGWVGGWSVGGMGHGGVGGCLLGRGAVCGRRCTCVAVAVPVFLIFLWCSVCGALFLEAR